MRGRKWRGVPFGTEGQAGGLARPRDRPHHLGKPHACHASNRNCPCVLPQSWGRENPAPVGEGSLLQGQSQANVSAARRPRVETQDL